MANPFKDPVGALKALWRWLWTKLRSPVIKDPTFAGGFPEITKVSAVVIAVLAIIGVSTDSLGSAARSATIPLAALAMVLVLVAIIPTAGTSKPITWLFLIVAVLFASTAATTIWAANVPSRPALTATIGEGATTLTVSAKSSDIGSIDHLDVAVYAGFCPADWENGTWPKKAHTSLLYYARVGADAQGNVDMSHVIHLRANRLFEWVCMTARIEAPTNIASRLDVWVPPPPSGDGEDEQSDATPTAEPTASTEAQPEPSAEPTPSTGSPASPDPAPASEAQNPN